MTWLALMALLLRPQHPPDVDALIDELNADSLDRREAVVAKLIDAGAAAQPALVRRQATARAELRARIEQALLGIRIRRAGAVRLHATHEFSIRRGRVTALAWSPEGHAFASAGEAGDVIVWNGVTRDVMLSLTDLSSEVDTLAFSPTGDRLAASDQQHSVVWDLSRVRELHRFARTISLAWSPDGKRLACGYPKAGGVSILETEKWTVQRHLEADGAASAWSKDAKRLSCGGQGAIAIFDAEKGELLRKLRLDSDDFLLDLTYVQNNALVYATNHGTVQCGFGRAKVTDALAVAATADGSRIAVATPDGIQTLDRVGGKRSFLQTGYTNLRCLAYRPDGSALAYAQDDRIIVRERDAQHELTGHLQSLRNVTFSRDSRYLIASGTSTLFANLSTGETRDVDMNCRVLGAAGDSTFALVHGSGGAIWDAADGRQIRPISPTGMCDSDVTAVSPNGACLVFAVEDQWNGACADELACLSLGATKPEPVGSLHGVLCIAWTRDSDRFAVGARDSVEIYDTTGRHRLHVPTGEPVGSVAFDPTGRWIAWSDHRRTHIASAATGEERARVEANGAWWHILDEDVALSLDGAKIHLWHWPTLTRAGSIEIPRLSSIAVAPDNNSLAVTACGVVRVYRIAR